ncbi:MAG: hypothetical protein AB3A66_30280 (plasmid) [Nodularia sp. CChRGM 3473]
MRTLTFKGHPITTQEKHEGFEIIVTYCQPDPYDLGCYFYYIRNSNLEIVDDNTKGHGEDSIDSAILKAKDIIENYLG